MMKILGYHKGKDDGYPSLPLCFSHYLRRNDALNNMDSLKNVFDDFQDLVKKQSSTSGTSLNGRRRKRNKSGNSDNEDNDNFLPNLDKTKY